MLQINRRGSALIIALAVTMIILIVTIYLLERIVPISRNVKGIENGNRAYYQAQSAVEEVLVQLDPANPGTSIAAGDTLLAGTNWYKYSAIVAGNKVPLATQGNSEYDKNWNRLWLGQPVQLKLPAGALDWGNNVSIYIKTPKVNSTMNTMLADTTTPLVSWILSGSGQTLYADNSQLKGAQINNVTNDPLNPSVSWKLWPIQGVDLAGGPQSFQSFYNTNCLAKVCTLKLGLVSNLQNDVPYLEYQIDFWWTSVPQQYAIISTEWYSNGFRQDIKKSFQQLTTNEALDFTIFQ